MCSSDLAAVGALATGRGGKAGGGDQPAEQSLTLAPRPFEATVGLAGTVVAGERIDIIAPFDGGVRKLGFEYGAPVTQGQVLAELDAGETAQRRNEAESAYLKAVDAETDAASPGGGPDVTRARRALAGAELSQKDVDRRMQETKGLLDKGLVARTEYDTLAQQQQLQAMAVDAARDDLAQAIRKSRGSGRRVAALDLQNAGTRLNDLNTRLQGAVIRAPEAGIVVRPPSDKADANAGVHVGSTLAKGQLIGSIARPDRLAVAFKLDEADANRVRPGQAVRVTGPGFNGAVLSGHVASVAGEAAPSGPLGAAKATFSARVQIDGMTPEQAAVIRIGMSAEVTIILHRSDAALVLPPAAVQGVLTAAAVKVRDRSGVRQVPVRLGFAAPDGIEVLGGLKPGDTVVWTPPAPPPTPGAPS